MTKAIRFHEYGGPQVLHLEDVDLGDPGPNEARIRQYACGINFLDTYQRSGQNKVPLPSGAGNEGAGVVEAVGSAVRHLKVGNRVAYAGGPVAAYAEARNIPADFLCVLPEGLSFEQGAAMMLKGMTVEYLIHRTYKVQPGDVVLFHAASGGVGLIACQWLKALGAVVIGTAGSEEKCELARRHGADHSINYRNEDFVERVKAITNGAGVPVVYDSVGKDTFLGSIQCLRPFGLMVSFGSASGLVPPVDPLLLARSGSLYFTRPTLFTHIAKRADIEVISRDLFETVLSGKVKITVERRYPLADAARAHRDLEARLTTGASILVP